MKTQINVTTTQKIIAAVIVLLLFVMGCFTGIAFYNFNMKKVPASVEQKLPEKTCEAIEKLLKQELIAESSLDFRDHEINANVYKKLATNGCPENIEIYVQLVQRELQIANALNQEGRAPLMVSETEATCVQIESFLTNKLQEKYSGSMNAYDHIGRAQIYANLSERGCANHSEEYKDLAKRELEIARALEDDRIDNHYTEEQTNKCITKITELTYVGRICDESITEDGVTLEVNGETKHYTQEEAQEIGLRTCSEPAKYGVVVNNIGMLDQEDALLISTNWNYDDLKLYNNDDQQIQDYEKDACEVLKRLEKFIKNNSVEQ